MLEIVQWMQSLQRYFWMFSYFKDDKLVLSLVPILFPLVFQLTVRSLSSLEHSMPT